MRHLSAAVLAALPASSAFAQDNPVSPFEITCAQLMAPADENQQVAGNMMVMWAVGYFYGRFGEVPGANVTPEGYDRAVNDLVNALKQVCPNVPEMPIAVFTENLANDFAQTLEQQQ